MDDSSVVWKYVRYVDSVRAAIAHQGQDLTLEVRVKAKVLTVKAKAWTKDHSFVPKDDQGLRAAKDNIPQTTTIPTERRVCHVPRQNSTFGDRSFAVAGPRTWNELPFSLRDTGLSLTTFNEHLKTYLFFVAF